MSSRWLNLNVRKKMIEIIIILGLVIVLVVLVMLLPLLHAISYILGGILKIVFNILTIPFRKKDG